MGRWHKSVGLYAHLNWRTWRRQKMVRAGDVSVVANAILAAGARTRVRVHAQAILADHVHVLVSYPSDATLSAFVRDAKSESSRRVNDAAGLAHLKWCRGFYAASLNRHQVRAVRVYLGRQHRHHPDLVPA